MCASSPQVLVSTHHYDDVDVLSSQAEDSIWFLDERFLRYSGPLSRVRTLHIYCTARYGGLNSVYVYVCLSIAAEDDVERRVRWRQLLPSAHK